MLKLVQARRSLTNLRARASGSPPGTISARSSVASPGEASYTCGYAAAAAGSGATGSGTCT